MNEIPTISLELAERQEFSKRFKTDWSVTDDEWIWLAHLVPRYGIKSVLEFGPGYSTLAFDPCSMICFESDWIWADRLRDLGFPSQVLAFTATSFALALPGFELDLGFVDGPPGDTMHYARLNTALACISCCERLCLHDTHRAGEKRTLEILMNLGCKEIDRYDAGKGLVLLECPA